MDRNNKSNEASNDPTINLANHLGLEVERWHRGYRLVWRRGGGHIGPLFDGLEQMDWYLQGMREGIREGKERSVITMRLDTEGKS